MAYSSNAKEDPQDDVRRDWIRQFHLGGSRVSVCNGNGFASNWNKVLGRWIYSGRRTRVLFLDVVIVTDIRLSDRRKTDMRVHHCSPAGITGWLEEAVFPQLQGQVT